MKERNDNPSIVALCRTGLVLAVVLGGIAPRWVLACSCAPSPPAKEALKHSAVVFAGKVLEIARMGNSHTVRFEVSQSWKGVTAKAICVTTPTSTAACGFAFVPGREYPIYAFRPSGRKALVTNLCTRTKLLSEAKQDLADLGVGEGISAAGTK